MKKKKFKSPFKDKGLLISEINNFLNKYRTVFRNQSSRISDYFEMSVYNSIVKYYESSRYNVRCANLINGEFRYKLTPTGYPQNFSYFIANNLQIYF